MAKSNGIKDLKQAAKLLNKHAPDGESLAYINPDEGRLLKAHGGSGIETLSGVPTYGPIWEFAKGFIPDAWEPALEAVGTGIQTVGNWLGYGDKQIPDPNNPGKTITQPGRSIVDDAMSVWVALEAKKNQEGLNEHEQKIYNDLKSQMAAAEREFAVNVAGGPSVTDVPTKIEDVASFTDVTLPALKTTAVAEGGRIGYNLGGIGAMDPRIGYQMGSPHGQVIPTFSEGVEQEFPSNELGVLEAQSNIQGKNTEQELMSLVQALMQSEKYEIDEAIDIAKKILEEQENQITGWAQGGRIGYEGGGEIDLLEKLGLEDLLEEMEKDEADRIFKSTKDLKNWKPSKPTYHAQGGRIGAKEGGIMPLLNLGGMEKDYRQDGGFVPIGRREKADDVPARLSKNEFVFTADAVRAAGGGDIDQGAQRMYNVMKNLEAGGEISEQSQGKA